MVLYKVIRSVKAEVQDLCNYLKRLYFHVDMGIVINLFTYNCPDYVWIFIYCLYAESAGPKNER
jgi:hypothetical protein